MSAPLHIVLDLDGEVTNFLQAMKQLGEDFVSDWSVGRIVSDLFSYMYDKKSVPSYINAYISDCVEVFANDCVPIVAAEVQADNFYQMPLSPEATRAFNYGNAIEQLGSAIFNKLQQFGMYNEDDILCYSFQSFVGRDAMLEYVSPVP